MNVGEISQRNVVTVNPDDTLLEAARRMTEHNVGCAVVPTDEGPAIITERDLLRAISAGEDLATAAVATHMTSRAVTATPGWDLGSAAKTMLDGGFRHLVVVDRDGTLGVLSIRDLMSGMLEASPSTPRSDAG